VTDELAPDLAPKIRGVMATHDRRIALRAPAEVWSGSTDVDRSAMPLSTRSSGLLPWFIFRGWILLRGLRLPELEIPERPRLRGHEVMFD
jgi:hypothetical protein